MKTILSIAVVALTASAYKIPIARRLDTTNVQFIDDSLVGWVEENEVEFNENLAKDIGISKIGDHGFIVDANRDPAYYAMKRKQAFPEKNVGDSGEINQQNEETLHEVLQKMDALEDTEDEDKF